MADPAGHVRFRMKTRMALTQSKVGLRPDPDVGPSPIAPTVL
jgi:hypothetical protein